jgi:transcriptional regulator with XRE-family HTH domain
MFTVNLRKARKKNGLTQQELADHMKVSIDTVRRWESGESKPNYEDIINLSQVLEVSKDVFFGDGMPQKEHEDKNNSSSLSISDIFQELTGTNVLSDFDRILLAATATKTAIEQSGDMPNKDINILQLLLNRAQDALREKRHPITPPMHTEKRD